MYSHMVVGSNDLDKAKTFYDAMFGALGARPAITDDKGRLVYMHAGSLFFVTKPINGEPACYANGGTVGFQMDRLEQTDAWHRAGVANGGTPIEDTPGIRSGGYGDLYLGYLRDPDGNKLCGMHRMPKAA